jgi:hypothetical protein
MVIAFSPTLIFTEIAILTKSKRPLRLTLAFIGGIAVPVILLALLALALYNPSAQIHVPKTSEVLSVTPLLDIIVGVGFVFASFHLGNKPKKASKFDPEKLFSYKTMFIFGAIKMATSLSSIAAILLAARFLKATLTNSTQQLFGVLWLVIAALLPFIIILLVDYFSPKRFAIIRKYSDKASELNWLRILALALQVGGISLIVFGIINIGNSMLV